MAEHSQGQARHNVVVLSHRFVVSLFLFCRFKCGKANGRFIEGRAVALNIRYDGHTSPFRCFSV